MPRGSVLSMLFALVLVLSCGGDGAVDVREAPPAPGPAACGAAELTLPDGRAEGRYQEDVLFADKPVRLWGRCPA